MKVALFLSISCLIMAAGCKNVESPNAEDMPDNKGIISIGVVVEDLYASLDFYTRIIGMKEVREFSIDESFGENSGLSRGAPFNVKVLQLIEGDYSTNWKLIQFDDQPGTMQKANIQDDIGMQYITINVEDLGPYIERLKVNGIELLGSTPVPLSGGRHFVLVKDPNEIFIELIGPIK